MLEKIKNGEIMTLREYLFKNNISIRQFAKLLGYTDTQIGEVSRGRRKPSEWLAELIEKTTNTKVTKKEMFNVPYTPKKRKTT